MFEPASTEELNQPPMLGHYLDVLWKRKLLVAGLTVVTLAATALWTFTRTRIYRASATVLVSQSPPEVLGTKVREVVDLSHETLDNQQYIHNQVVLACSTAVARQAAKALMLAHRADFWNDDSRHSIDQAADAVVETASCKARHATTILDISVSHRNPEMAALIANAMANAYIEKNLEYKLSSTLGAVHWLGKRLKDMGTQLDASEKRLFEFKEKNGLLAVPLTGQQNLLTMQVEHFSKALADFRVQRFAAAAEVDQLRAVDLSDPRQILAGPMLDSKVLQRLRIGYDEERRKYAELKERYLERHPAVVQQKSRMESTGDDLVRYVRNEINGREAMLRKLRKQEAQLSAAIATVKEQALALSRKEEAYRQLKRPVDTTNELYGVLLSRLEESSLSGQLRVNNLQLLQSAVAPAKPVEPRVELTLVIGALLGLLLGLGLAFLLDGLDSSVKSAQDIEQVTGMTCLGAIPGVREHVKGQSMHPALDRSPALVVQHWPMSVPAESFRIVRTSLMFSSPDAPVRTIVVTSAGPKEGKTTIAVGLATAVAQAGNSVLLVDADMRQPQLHRIFEVSNGEGLSTALRDPDVDLDSIVRETGTPNLRVLPSGPVPPNPAELCQSERLANLIRRLSEKYDRIFLDSPPAMLVTDPALLAAKFDATLLVVRTDKTQKKTLQDCHRQLTEVGAKVIGCVLNDLDVGQRGSRYYVYRDRAYTSGRPRQRLDGGKAPA